MCYSALEDFLFWPHSQTGLYQVRSGYKLLCELSSNELASSSDAVGEKKFWSSLWKLIVPNKVKSFLWRACTNSISTMQNLHKRKVASSSICSLYNEKEESTIHALWSCDNIRLVWDACFASLPSKFSRVTSFLDLVDLVFSSHLNFEAFAMT